MDSMTYLIKKEIHRQYKSVAAFSRASGIPYMTCSNAVTKGISNMAFDTVVKMCSILGIKQSYEEDIVLFNREFHDIYSKLTQLDEKGVHTVVTILNVEYQRCMNEGDGTVKGYNGIGYIEKHAFDEDEVMALVRKVKEHEE